MLLFPSWERSLAADLRKRVDIEELVCWAFRDELSKKVTSSAEGVWDAIRDYAQRGGIDVGHGAAQRYPHFGLPHPDALALERAIARLPNLSIEHDMDRAALFGDLAPVIEARDWLQVRTIKTAVLVTANGVLARRPAWGTGETPRPVGIKATRGTGFAVVGECKGHNRYSAGSYCPLRYEPAPISIVRERADYAAWHWGLQRLAGTLELSPHVGRAPAAPPPPRV